jgi:hypothetical protein
MSGIVNTDKEAATNCTQYYSNKKLRGKLFAAYVTEQLTNATSISNAETKAGTTSKIFDDANLFYLLSLAEKLPVYGVGFSNEEIH